MQTVDFDELKNLRTKKINTEPEVTERVWLKLPKKLAKRLKEEKVNFGLDISKNVAMLIQASFDQIDKDKTLKKTDQTIVQSVEVNNLLQEEILQKEPALAEVVEKIPVIKESVEKNAQIQVVEDLLPLQIESEEITQYVRVQEVVVSQPKEEEEVKVKHKKNNKKLSPEEIQERILEFQQLYHLETKTEEQRAKLSSLRETLRKRQVFFDEQGNVKEKQVKHV